MRAFRRSDWMPVVQWAAIGGVAGAAAWLLGRPAAPGVRSGSGPLTPTNQCGPEPPSESGAARLLSAPTACTSSFPENLAQRNAYILDKVSKGDFHVDWVPVKSSANGHTATFWVTGDALKVDGVRVNADAITEQKIADAIGAMLLTPKLADLIFQQADIRLLPMPRPITSSSLAMADQSMKIDQAIISKVGSLDAARDKLVSTVGKHWVVTNELGKAGPSKAQNYGWHFVGVMAGVPNENAVSGVTDPATGKAIKVIQGPWMAHGPTHTDYSQNVVLVSKTAEVDGRRMTMADVLSSPELAPLASHQGVVRTLRQPGVPEAPGVA